MKILILCDQYLPVSEQFIRYQISALAQNELFLFARKKVNGITAAIKYEEQLIWYQNPLDRIRYKFSQSSRQYPAFIQNRLRRFVERNKVDLIYVHYGTTAVNYQVVLSDLPIPVICALHGFDASRKLSDADYRESLVILSNHFAQLTVPSYYLKEKLTAVGVKEDKVMVLPYGTDIDKISSIAPERITEAVTIVHAGRLVPKKGVVDLLTVFLQLCEVHADIQLLIIGGGEEEETVRQMVQGTDYKRRIKLMGPLPHDQLIRMVKGSDVFVLNSRESESGETEGLPNTIIEAMAAEVAVVSTRHSGIPEMITDGVNGVLVAPKSKKALHAALDILIRDKDLRSHLVTNASAYVMEHLSLSAMVKRIQSLVTSIAEH